jgi:hypothetical protein
LAALAVAADDMPSTKHTLQPHFAINETLWWQSPTCWPLVPTGFVKVAQQRRRILVALCALGKPFTIELPSL